ncbi:MAG: hypothetical protein QW356_08490 [Candidatus Hadarchaeales archaeon]
MGGSLLWVPDQPDYLYALGGGSFDENGGYGFYRYRISTDTWEVLENLPYPVGYYNGNRLAYAQGNLFYWAGNALHVGRGRKQVLHLPPPGPSRQPATRAEFGRDFPLLRHFLHILHLRGGLYRSRRGCTFLCPCVRRRDPPGDGEGERHVLGGALYRCSLSLPSGQHSFWFGAQDNRGARCWLPKTGEYSGPQVTEAPPAKSSSPCPCSPTPPASPPGRATPLPSS